MRSTCPLIMIRAISHLISPRYEHNLIRLVLLANIMIVSSEIRRAPYADMLCMSLGSSLFDRHIEHLLHGVIGRIAFLSLRQLFETHAASVTLRFLEDQRDISRLSPSILGYASRRESANAIVSLGLPLALLDSDARQPDAWRQFRHIISIAGIVEKDALRNIFPLRVAFGVCAAFDNDEPMSSRRSAELWQKLADWSSEVSDGEAPEVACTRHLDSILSHMLLVVGEVDMGPNGDLYNAVQSSLPANHELDQLLKFRGQDTCIHRPNAPLYFAHAVLDAVRWLQERFQSSLPVAETLYHALHRILRSVVLSPLMNEKIRGLNAICLACALYPAVFHDSTALLRTLIYGVTPFLAQPDLSHRAQSIIQWACNVYAEVGRPDPRFPEVLVRIANIASDLSRAQDVVVSAAGTALMEWVAAIGTLLSSVKDLVPQMKLAMLLWPKAIPVKGTNGLSYRDISRTLADEQFTSNKFRLVQKLQQAILENESFNPSHGDFWLLKGCIPDDANLADADLDAYLDVLATQAGAISSFQEAYQGRRSVGQRHRHETRSSKKTPTFVLVLPHHAILTALIDRMHLADVATRDVAYQSLRLLLSLSQNHLASWKAPPEDIVLIASRPVDLLPRSDVNMVDLATSQTFVDTAYDYPNWIKKVTQFLCDALSHLDEFYAQLRPSIESDHDFAAEVFPVAVHELLRRQDEGANRGILSNYFQRILTHPTTSLQSLRILVETCLHLRNFHHNPVDESPTGNNRWLDIEPSLLSVAATKCGAYTTALLFIELGRETTQSSQSAYLLDQESTLYDIYSHIEEPDGFYGIKTQDVASFLVRRFRHENEWDKAFRYDSAAFEGLPNSDAGKALHSQGIVQALHASGLNNLAVAVKETFGQGHSSSSAIDVELAWRTENWELPITSTDTTSGVPLFCALRAIHREGDASAIGTVVDDSIRREVAYLRDLGNERMPELKASVRRLLCLREAKEWTRETTRLALASDAWSKEIGNRWIRVGDHP